MGGMQVVRGGGGGCDECSVIGEMGKIPVQPFPENITERTVTTEAYSSISRHSGEKPTLDWFLSTTLEVMVLFYNPLAKH